MANLLNTLGISKRSYIADNISPSKDITQADTFLYGASATTVSTLLGTGSKIARQRQLIYEKWAFMESDAICSSALMLLVTAALGGNEKNGQMVFIEKNPEFHTDKRMLKLADEIAKDLEPIINRDIFKICYTGAAFGDSYARIYSEDRTGLVDLYTDELVRPPLVQPFDRGSRTVGYAVYVGPKNFERLDVSQLGRFKMPRTSWVPQTGVVEKSMRIALTENDLDALPIMPSMAGGSLLYNAEKSFDDLHQSLLGLVGQRWMDSVDEQIVTLNMENMTKDQQDRFLKNIVEMLKKSKKIAQDAVKRNQPVLERIRHIIPVFNEKQVTQIGPANGGSSGRAGNISIEDIMIHAKLLSASIGVDISMLGFADQLGGGLGEGGFFRTSVQSAQNSRIIRAAAVGYINHLIDIHCLAKYGFVFPENKRPYRVNFYGSISALEEERQRTRTEAMNSALLLVQAIQQFKEAGATKEQMQVFLTKELLMDEADANLYAKIVDAPDEDGPPMPSKISGEEGV